MALIRTLARRRVGSAISRGLNPASRRRGKERQEERYNLDP